MSRTFEPLIALLSGVALLMLGHGLLGTVLAVRGGLEGFGSQVLGAIGAMYFVGFLAGTYLAPRLVQRVGHVRAFAFFTALVACSALLHELLMNAGAWMVLRLLTGLSMVGFYTIVESWLNSHAQPEHRARVFTVYMGVNLGSLALAQQLLQSSDPSGHVLFSIAALSICAAIMPVAATRLKQPTVEGVSGLGVKALYAKAPVACSASFLSGFSQGAFWGLGAVWADTSGLGTTGVAWFMTIVILGGALLQWPIGQVTNRMDRGHVITFVAVSAAAMAMFMQLASAHSLVLVLGAAFVYGGFAFALYPMAMARLMDRLESREILAGCSSLLLVHGVGASIGPVIAGGLMEHFGPPALTTWFAGIELLLGLTAWYLSKQAPADIAHQTPFKPMIRTSPTAMEMLEPQSTPPASEAESSPTTRP